MTALAVITGMTLTAIMGMLFIRLIAPHTSSLEKLSLGYGIGLGLLAELLLLISMGGVKLTRWTSFATLVALLAVLCILCSKRRRKGRQRRATDPLPGVPLATLDLLIIILLLILSTSALVFDLYMPITNYDGLQTYDSRAQLIFMTGNITLEKGHRDVFLLYADYPILVTLAHSWVYFLAGGIINPKFLYALYYSSFMLIIYSLISRSFSSRTALICVLLFATMPFSFSLATQAGSSGIYAYYLGLGGLYLCQWIRNRRPGDLIISAVLLGLASFTRIITEPFFLVALFVALLFSLKAIRKNIIPLSVFCLVFAAFWLPWKLFLIFTQNVASKQLLGTFFREGFFTIEMWRIREVFIRTFWVHCFQWKTFYPHYGVIWHCFALSIVLFPREIRRNLPVLIALCGYIVTVFASMYFTRIFKGYSDPAWFLLMGGSGRRMIMVAVPLLVYYMASPVERALQWLSGINAGGVKQEKGDALSIFQEF